MGMSKLRLLTLLIIAILLGACATQEAAEDVAVVASEPAMPSEETLQCYRECEYVNGGTVRGCTIVPSGRSRSASYIRNCVNNASGQLKVCYNACE